MNPKTSSNLFNKIRSQFSNIEIGVSTGQPTADPQEAVFFDFEFAEDADTFGRVSVSLADGEDMKVSGVIPGTNEPIDHSVNLPSMLVNGFSLVMKATHFHR